jgi:hypothetical protein
VLIVEAAQLELLETGVKLDLVDRRHDAGGVDDSLEMLNLVMKMSPRSSSLVNTASRTPTSFSYAAAVSIDR